jgi:hypothetical protein
MRTKLRSKITLLFMTFGLLLAIPAVALADQVLNNVVAGGNDTIAAGNSTTINYRVNPGGGADTQGGCNVNDGTAATVTINKPAAVTASPGSLSFDACNTDKPVVFSSSTPGNYSITVSVSDSGGGTFNTGPAAFTLHVNDNCPSGDLSGNNQDGSCAAPPPANTTPHVSVTGVTDGASYDKGSVPDATCQVTDTEDGNSSFAATLSEITGDYASDGIGQQTATCSYTDNGGLSDSDLVTYSITDPSAPVITKDVTGTLGSNGWYTSNVGVDWTVSDPESPNSLQTTGCEDQTITADQAATPYNCSATSAGGASNDSVTIKRDATPPQINDDGTTQSPNGALWFKAAVLNDFSASDATSGLANSGDANFSKSSGTAEGSAVKINSGTVSDLAGNTNAGIDSAAFKIDLTKPSVNVTGITNGATYTTGNVPTPGCNTTDGLSGVKTDATVSVTGGTGGFGTLTATCSGAVDNADNAQATTTPVSVTYGVSAAFNGFLQPIDGHSVNTGKWGRTYPIKWQLRDSSGALISDTTAQLLVGTMTGGQKAVSCGSFDLSDSDALEASTTGNTSLRYDATSDQFIYNYKAPSTGSCYVFAIRNADGLTTQQIDFQFTK